MWLVTQFQRLTWELGYCCRRNCVPVMEQNFLWNTILEKEYFSWFNLPIRFQIYETIRFHKSLFLSKCSIVDTRMVKDGLSLEVWTIGFWTVEFCCSNWHVGHKAVIALSVSISPTVTTCKKVSGWPDMSHAIFDSNFSTLEFRVLTLIYFVIKRYLTSLFDHPKKYSKMNNLRILW